MLREVFILDRYVKKIYDLLYSPIVTPYNLLENAKLQNYSYVNFYKGQEGLVAEMKCLMEDLEEAIFYYHFDTEDKLLKIFMEKEGFCKALMFDRIQELEKTKKDYLTGNKKDIAV
ncbi:MAG: hypothetical protein ACOYVD_16300 [Bacillota bacterium]